MTKTQPPNTTKGRNAIRRTRGLGAVAAAGAVIMAAAFPHLARIAPGRSGIQRPDIVLITIDTLRADHLGCYGYPRDTSPNIDRFARHARLFENAVSASAFTGPSVASILTGLYPRFHTFGYQNHGTGLEPRETTVAEWLRRAGYHTAAIVSNPVLERGSGMEQGFESYDDTMEHPELVRTTHFERVAPETTDAALRWLAGQAPQERIFLWVHYQDPHGPYTPPSAHAARFLSGDPGPEVPRCEGRDNSGHGCIPWYQALPGLTRRNEYVDRYDAEIAFMDEHLGRLLDGLQTGGRYDAALIILTADHGEALGENGYYFAHGHDVTPDQAHVPLIVKAPGQRKAEHSAAWVSHVDILPTLLGSAAVREPGATLRPGVNLLDPRPPPHRVVYCDTGDRLGVYAEGRLLAGKLRTREPEAIAALRPDDFKPAAWYEQQRGRFVRSDAGPATDGLPRSLAALRRAARAYLSTKPAERFQRPRSPSLLGRLRALGYVGEDED